MPTWLLCVLLVLVLTVTGARTLQKAIGARQKERWQCGVNPETTSLLAIRSTGPFDILKNVAAPVAEVELQATVPWGKVAALVGLFVTILGMNVLRGGKHFASPLGIDSTSTLFPALVALPFVFLAVVSYFSLQSIVATYRKQQSPDYELSPHEIQVRSSVMQLHQNQSTNFAGVVIAQWTTASIRYFPALSLMAGMVSGMFGIGGGIINGPLLLELGIDASAASAMTATTVLFSSGMSSFNYLLMGSLDLHLAQLMLPMGFLMTYIGHVCLLKVVRRFNCPSLIIFSMAIIVLISAVAMSVESIRALIAA
ncbi:hypothetical protein BBJ28_00000480 [Nothophytophthora sp. Chile5]|nr:hypothetical protein BBJ28_00000480 [Nothophytophthora sp. Chile5]